eukprot:3873433-Amphidinium_carterae.1
MESATDALDFDLYVEEKRRETVSLYFRLVVLTDKTTLGGIVAGWRSATHQGHGQKPDEADVYHRPRLWVR